MCVVPEREDTLLCPALFLVAPGTAKGSIESVFVQCLDQSLGFHHVGMQGTAMVKRVDVLFHPFRVDVNDQVHAGFLRDPVTELIHGLELPAGVYMQ